MNGVPFSFADCEATFGPEAKARKDREAEEAPRFTPDQIFRLRVLCAPLRAAHARPAGIAADAA
ncbi:hypothetical protein [Streptomyces sp. NPDC001422]|uniref:hypothetical protein n=1 Tax=Streptomyces sp. NPDC001422 TaxID=3364575 RepID=UPI003696B434